MIGEGTACALHRGRAKFMAKLGDCRPAVGVAPQSVKRCRSVFGSGIDL